MAVSIVALALTPALAGAVDCTVPGVAHSTVQGAIDDLACTTINLLDQSYPESLRITRSVPISGPATLADIDGFVEVQGSGTVVNMNNLKVENGCTPEAFLVTDGGQVNSSRLEVVWVDGAPCPPSVSTTIFSDGFEIGNSSRWSATVP